MGISSEFANQILNASLSGAYFIGLFVNDVELSGDNYARQVFEFSSANGKHRRSSGAVTFPRPENDWGLVTRWGVFSAETGGDLLFSGTMKPPVFLSAGRALRLDIGAIDVDVFEPATMQGWADLVVTGTGTSSLVEIERMAGTATINVAGTATGEVNYTYELAGTATLTITATGTGEVSYEPEISFPTDVVQYYALEGSPLDRAGTRHGVHVKTPTYTASGLQLGNPNTIVSMPAASITEAISVFVWFEPSANQQNMGLVTKGNLGDTQGDWALCYNWQGFNQIMVRMNNDTKSLSGPILPTTGRQLIGFTYDRTNLKIFVNGEQVATTPYTAAINNTSSTMWLGTYYNTINNPQGVLGPVSIFDRALTALEISDMWNEGEGVEPDLGEPVLDGFYRNVVFASHFDSEPFTDITGRHGYVGATNKTVAPGLFGGNGQRGTVDNAAVIYDSNLSDFDFGSGDVTLEFAVKYDTVTESLILSGGHIPGSGLSWQVALNSSTGKIAVYAGGWIIEDPTAPTAGVFYRYAITVKDSVMRMYRDGTKVAQANVSFSGASAMSNPFAVGGSSNATQYGVRGTVDEVRITKGIARYYGDSYTLATDAFVYLDVPDVYQGNVVFLARFTSASLADETGRHALQGVPGITAIDGPGGTKIAVGAGGASGLRYAGGTDFNFQANKFTVEFTIKPTNRASNDAQALFAFHAVGVTITWQLAIENTGAGGKVALYHPSHGYAIQDTTVCANDVEYKFALVQDATSLNLYRDGVRVATRSTINFGNPGESLGIAGVSNSSNYGLIGQISNIRVTKGVARYSGASYTPPTNPLPPYQS